MPSIPDDIRAKATAIVNRFTVAANTTQNLEAIAEAIIAERQRCVRACAETSRSRDYADSRIAREAVYVVSRKIERGDA